MYMITIASDRRFRPNFLPDRPQTTWRERFSGLRNLAPVLLFIFVIGGLYGLPVPAALYAHRSRRRRAPPARS